MPVQREDGDLVKAARLYFQDGLSQQEVAAAIGTSRSNVSRMLTAARERGVVQVRIVDPAGRDAELEALLGSTFGLAEVLVAAFEAGASALDRVGLLGATWLLDNLRDGQRLALSWGTALQRVVGAVTADRGRQVEIVQLVGGLSPVPDATTGQELVRELAVRLGANYRYLHAPALLASADATAALVAERSVAEALRAARRADIALVGVGATGHGSSENIVAAMHLSARERSAFLAEGPVGDICARFYAIDGRAVHGPTDDRVLAVDLEDLRRIPTVVGVAAGAEKAPGVLGAVRGGYLDVLICDSSLARGVLALNRQESAVPDRTGSITQRGRKKGQR